MLHRRDDLNFNCSVEKTTSCYKYCNYQIMKVWIHQLQMSSIRCQSADLAAQTKALQEQNAELEKEITELKRQLEEKIMVTAI